MLSDRLKWMGVVGAGGGGLPTLAAAYSPARRASRVDPMVALRHE